MLDWRAVRRDVLLELARAGQLTNERQIAVRRTPVSLLLRDLAQPGTPAPVRAAAGLPPALPPDTNVEQAVTDHLTFLGAPAVPILRAPFVAALRRSMDRTWLQMLHDVVPLVPTGQVWPNLPLSDELILWHGEGPAWLPLGRLVMAGIHPVGLDRSREYFWIGE